MLVATGRKSFANSRRHANATSVDSTNAKLSCEVTLIQHGKMQKDHVNTKNKFEILPTGNIVVVSFISAPSK